MENVSAAFLEAVMRSMRAIREVLNATVIDPALLTQAERIQYDGFLLRQDNTRTVKALAAAGRPIKKIARQTGRSGKLVRSILRGGGGDVFRCCSSILEPFLVRLAAEWMAVAAHGAELWRRLHVAGFRGGVRAVAEWATRRRRAEELDSKPERARRTRRQPPAASKKVCARSGAYIFAVACRSISAANADSGVMLDRF
jgi:transposase